MARTHEQMVRDLFERWNSGIVELPREDDIRSRAGLLVEEARSAPARSATR